MKESNFKNLVSPITHKALFCSCENNEIVNEYLYSEDKSERYEIIKSVPILLPHNMLADWCRELVEVLLWEYPGQLNELVLKIEQMEYTADLLKFIVDFIRILLKDKNDVLRAIENYSKSDGMKWILKSDKANNNVPITAIQNFDKYSSKESGENRVNSFLSMSTVGWAFHLASYIELIFLNNPKTIVELSTGAGLGTTAVSYNMPGNCKLYTIDIDYACAGNAIGISKFLNIEDRLLPVVSNFWFLPFKDNSLDVVCAHYGLDESREVPQTIKEVSRILKIGGEFVCTARKNAFDREHDILEPLGFTKEEADPLLKKARLYSGPDDLIDDCKNNGLSLVSRKDFLKPNHHERVILAFKKI